MEKFSRRRCVTKRYSNIEYYEKMPIPNDINGAIGRTTAIVPLTLICCCLELVWRWISRIIWTGNNSNKFKTHLRLTKFSPLRWNFASLTTWCRISQLTSLFSRKSAFLRRKETHRNLIFFTSTWRWLVKLAFKILKRCFLDVSHIY